MIPLLLVGEGDQRHWKIVEPPGGQEQKWPEVWMAMEEEYDEKAGNDPDDPKMKEGLKGGREVLERWAEGRESHRKR